MLKPFIVKIKDTIIDRAIEVEEQVLTPDPRYQELNTKLNEVLDQIAQNLPPGKERLLLELDSFWVERDVLAYRKIVQPRPVGRAGSQPDTKDGAAEL